MNDEINLALLVLRVVFGLTVATHGAQKLFGWWNGPGVAGFAGWLTSMRIPAPRASAVLAGLGEFGGGLLLALGLLTPLAALAIVTVMLVAILTVHLPKGWFVGDGGLEYNFAIIMTAIVIAIAGPGEWSIDHAIGLTGDDWSGWIWGVGVAVIGVVLAGGLVAARPNAEPGDRSDADEA